MKIILKKVKKKFQSNVSILSDINSDFLPGKITVILGRSGSGKSTLLNCISGVESIDSGTIQLENTTINQLNPNQCADFRLKHIGFIYQFFHLIPSLTIKENILLPSTLQKKTPKININGLLKKFDIEHIQNNWPDHLSGGESQRVALCRALITDPSIILADEPTGNLDQKNRDIVMTHLQRIAKEQQKTVIIVTHDTAFCDISDQTLELKNGLLHPK